HTPLRGPAHHQDPRPAARRVDVRPGMRIRRHARRGNQGDPRSRPRPPHPSHLRPGGEPHNLAIARMNLYLHGIEDHQIVRGDTLRQPKFRTEKGLARFDVVIANPPFSLKKWGADEWA